MEAIHHQLALDLAGQAIALAEDALADIFSRNGAVVPSAERRVQNAVELLRGSSDHQELRGFLEDVSALLFKMSLAQRTGRPNLHASTMQRLQRMVLADAERETGFARLH